ncbi:aspartic peptidase domain-containing protein [Xylariaceae sp. FL1272]|nr:aspartic peptidase domain-containing protein [Xylariaceae sp. FL1272]
MAAISAIYGGCLSALLPLGSAHVMLDLTRHQRHQTNSRLSQRVDQVNITQEDASFYGARIEIGTPGQAVTVEIDFTSKWGSNDVFVPATNSTTCQNTSTIYGGCWLGSFNSNISRTFTPLSGGYAKSAETFEDVINFGGVNLTDIIVVQAYNLQSDDLRSVVTPSLSLLDAPGDNPIPSVLYQLVDQGHITTVGFSIWLEDTENSNGQLLLGAIDEAKFSQPLISLEAYGETPATGTLENNRWNNSLRLLMTSMSANSSTGDDSLTLTDLIPIQMNLQTSIILPQALALQAWKIAGVTQHVASNDGNSSLGVIPCLKKDSEGVFTFGLGGSHGVSIEVHMQEMVFKPSLMNQDEVDNLGDDMCIFSIGFDANPLSWQLGVPLWSSIYAVVDLNNAKVAMAPINHESSVEESNIVSFRGQGAPIPSATQAPSQPVSPTTSLKYTFTKGVYSTDAFFSAEQGFGILTSTTTSGPSSTGQSAASSHAGLSRGGKIGVGIGVAVGVLVAVGVGGFCWGQRRGKRAEAKRVSSQAVQEDSRNEKPELDGSVLSSPTVQAPQETFFEVEAEGPRELSHFSEIFELPGGQPPYPLSQKPQVHEADGTRDERPVEMESQH